jgi:hypothetical protein
MAPQKSQNFYLSVIEMQQWSVNKKGVGIMLWGSLLGK